MASGAGPDSESYEDFYARWTGRQEELMNELEEALESDMKEAEMKEMVAKAEQHYQAYYDTKANAAQHDILKVATPSWRSPLEKAFLWLGGWRPSMALQLAYALAGQQIEAELAEFLEGIDSPTLASLSASQLSQISDLQISTVKDEKSLGHQMALLQQSIADEPLLSLAQADAMAEESEDYSNGIKDAMTEKLKTLEDISMQADSLRRSTLEKVLKTFDTLQKAQYLVAAAKLQAALRRIGKRMDGKSDGVML